VLIWGTIVRKTPKIYWTATHGEKKPSFIPLAEADFRLPEVFWNDFLQILQLLIAKLDAEFQAARGRYVADRLPPFINRVRKLLKESSGDHGWNADERYATRMILAGAQVVFGKQSGKNEPLEEAVAAYRAALAVFERSQHAYFIAGTKKNLKKANILIQQRK
jgi:hypothetical protein